MHVDVQVSENAKQPSTKTCYLGLARIGNNKEKPAVLSNKYSINEIQLYSLAPNGVTCKKRITALNST